MVCRTADPPQDVLPGVRYVKGYGHSCRSNCTKQITQGFVALMAHCGTTVKSSIAVYLSCISKLGEIQNKSV